MPESEKETVEVNKSTLSLKKDDITDLEVDAFVFYADENLALGSGFGTAISMRAGKSVEEELKELAPLPTGEAVVSSAGKMKAKYIVHAVGPKFREDDTEGKLRTTILNSLKRAEEKGIETLAFPAMGAGFYGIPLDLCARVMMDTIKGYLKNETGLREVVIVPFDTNQYRPFEKLIKAN